jgi:hypothetical protein
VHGERNASSAGTTAFFLLAISVTNPDRTSSCDLDPNALSLRCNGNPASRTKFCYWLVDPAGHRRLWRETVNRDSSSIILGDFDAFICHFCNADIPLESDDRGSRR